MLGAVLASSAGWCAAQGLGGHDAAAVVKTFEIGGYVESRLRHYGLNGDGAAYQVRFADEPRDSLDRSTALARIRGSARAEHWSMHFQALSEVERTQVSHDAQSRFDELFVSWNPRPGFSLDAGKIALKWGQGYQWNPVAFVERPKDPNDPRQGSEGYRLLAVNASRDFSGPLESVAFTTVLLPVTTDVNQNFGKPDHLNVAGKLQLALRGTDIGLYFLNNGSRAGRFGFDFSHDLQENLELYGEWARVRAQEFRLVNTAGTRYMRTEATSSYLVGARYRPDRRTHVIAELQHNGLGLGSDEFADFATLAQDAAQAGPGSGLMARSRSADDGLYGRTKPMRNYLYLRASRSMMPFSPSIRATVNLQDRSFSVAPELNYGSRGRWGVRLRYTLASGGSGTEYGEKYYSRIVDLRVHYHF